ncbi:MAG: 3-deoxy-D-manno-octulosonic acid transferase [Planctomycetaceae bacterium]|nr:3-deoxy-D-manno-octulosonic acid transferase [Planctomycetaceae bacterium]
MFRYVLNLIYVLLILSVSPVLIYRRWAQGKYRQGWSQKLWGNLPARQGDAPCLWFHAVSVGEVLQLEPIVASWKQNHPEWDIVISTTTNTGMQVAQDKFPDCLLCYCPLDFTWAVRKAFDRIRPTGFVLVELELWPNLIAEAHRRGVKSAIINGRLGEKSFGGYSRIRKLISPLLEPFDCIAVQNEVYKKRFESLGANANTVHDVGSMKFDRLMTDRHGPAVCELREAFGLDEKSLVFMAGSTHAPEEQIVLNVWKQLRQSIPELRLIIAPRHAERFDEVAQLIQQQGCNLIRRSEVSPLVARENFSVSNLQNTVLLLDTLGELSACWGLAQIAYVGGTLTNRGGQNMMEPSAYGCAVLLGPNTWNFADVVRDLCERNACLIVKNEANLLESVDNIIRGSRLRQRVGEAASKYVLSKRGATQKTIVHLKQILNIPSEAISSRAA